VDRSSCEERRVALGQRGADTMRWVTPTKKKSAPWANGWDVCQLLLCGFFFPRGSSLVLPAESTFHLTHLRPRCLAMRNHVGHQVVDALGALRQRRRLKHFKPREDTLHASAGSGRRWQCPRGKKGANQTLEQTNGRDSGGLREGGLDRQMDGREIRCESRDASRRAVPPRSVRLLHLQCSASDACK